MQVGIYWKWGLNCLPSSDALFDMVARIVRSNIWVAHLRRATCGLVSIENVHPFQWRSFVFAHNGHIREFGHLQPRLLELVDADLKGQRRGQTDSELIFHVLISMLRKNAAQALERDCDPERLAYGLLSGVAAISDIVGSFSEVTDRENPTTQLTFVLSNQNQIYAFNGGKPVFYKFYEEKSSPPRILVSSEMIGDADGWELIPFGSLLTVDQTELSVKTSPLKAVGF